MVHSLAQMVHRELVEQMEQRAQLVRLGQLERMELLELGVRQVLLEHLV